MKCGSTALKLAEETEGTAKKHKKNVKRRMDTHTARIQQLERELGCEHPDVGRECVHLARVCLMSGEPDTAQELMRHAQHLHKLWCQQLGCTPSVDACFAHIKVAAARHADAMKEQVQDVDM